MNQFKIKMKVLVIFEALEDYKMGIVHPENEILHILKTKLDLEFPSPAFNKHSLCECQTTTT